MQLKYVKSLIYTYLVKCDANRMLEFLLGSHMKRWKLILEMENSLSRIYFCLWKIKTTAVFLASSTELFKINKNEFLAINQFKFFNQYQP